MIMKRVLLLLLVPMILNATDYKRKGGFQFSFKSAPSIGLTYRFHPVYAIGAEFHIALDRDSTNFDTHIAYKAVRTYAATIVNQFYVPPIKDVEHYLYASAGYGYRIEEVDAVPEYKVKNQRHSLIGQVGYGIEYPVNEYFSVWGKLSLVAAKYEYDNRLDENENGVIETEQKTPSLKLLSLNQSALGISFYIW